MTDRGDNGQRKLKKDEERKIHAVFFKLSVSVENGACSLFLLN